MKDKKLFLLDVMPLLFRAHFATMGKKFATTTGIDTRTTLVFFNYIFQVITEEKPDAIVAALDSKAKQREAMAADYKANREKMPGEISDAFPYALQLMEALNIPVLKEEGYEADDIIASMAMQGEREGYTVFIVSPDKDFAQLVNNKIYLFRPAYKGATMEILDTDGVKTKYGVPPSQIADFLALRGDSVDNIPGVKGIGDKTAASLLEEFKSVEELVQNVGSVRQPKIKEALLQEEKQLLVNKRLAVLDGNLKVNFKWQDQVAHTPDEDKLIALLDGLQFVKIRERLEKQGYLNLKGATSSSQPVSVSIEPEKIEVLQTTIADAVEMMQEAQKISIAFLPDSGGLFFVTPGAENIYELRPKSRDEWSAIMKELDRDNKTVVGWQFKPLIKEMLTMDIELFNSWLDLSIAAYLLESDARIDIPYLLEKYQLRQYTVHHNEQLDFLPSILEAGDKILARIGEMKLSDLLFRIELPLQSVICRMEQHGTRIDLAALKEIDRVLSKQQSELEGQIYEMAGKRFNINSPSQTAEILRTIAESSELKKTKTGQISTAEPFLIELAAKYPFVGVLLDYRKLSKIISTYVYALPRYVQPGDDTLHPTFQQLVAGTGRLSCAEPNLQNLPIRNEAGREVRKAIVPSKQGYSILSADYNQIELRLLAALSEDKAMLDAFHSGKDIHTLTAARIFHVDEASVTSGMRSKAKGVNFGIAYGITPWGLSTRLKITQKEAKQIIDRYFDEFSSVKEYLQHSISETRERGFSRTRFGRIRYIDGIDSPNGTTRKMAERMAVNAPIQGLAADLIKEAMVAIDAFIKKEGLKSRMILQVHDELVFDAADEEVEILVPKLVSIMEAKGRFPVPLKVEVTIGPNWLDQEKYSLVSGSI